MGQQVAGKVEGRSARAAFLEEDGYQLRVGEGLGASTEQPLPGELVLCGIAPAVGLGATGLLS